MPKFYLHVSDGDGFSEDEEGNSFAGLEFAREAAIRGLREIMANELKKGKLDRGSFVEIENEDHELLETMTFDDVVIVSRSAPKD